jgi:2-phosphosulfolactate phosphatase
VGGRHDQRQFAVRMEWGLHGANAICAGADAAIIVDVLSFTTSLSVAIDAGAEVFPYRWKDASAREFAQQHHAILAVGRSEAARSAGQAQISLSPASIRAATGLARIVLPSPNGSALASQLAGSGATVVGGCLRNRTAVARWLIGPRTAGGTAPVIAVIAAGERWPDDSLRPAVEDLWGAGAIISALASQGATELSPEARSAAAAFGAVQASLTAALMSCSSGAELAGIGFGDDVEVAAELDASTSVPVLADGGFRNASQAR